MKRILIIDDDVHIGNALEEALRGAGYLASRAYSGTEALLALEHFRPDLALLDLMLPGLCGEEVLPKLRGIPVIVVSAKVGVEDKVALLRSGAADYVTKPFHMKELLARIEARLREPAVRPSALLTFRDLALDTDSRVVTAGEKSVHLTRTEYALLRPLMENPSRVITKSALLERVAEDSPDCTESSLKTHISNLRKKLRTLSEWDYIESVWGIGFKMREEP